MEKFNKITRIRLGLFAFYILTFFMPIYSQTFLGTIAKVSVIKLNAGIVFILIFLVAILVTNILYFIFEKYFKYAYTTTLILMGLFLLLLLFAKESNSVLRSSFYFQIITILLLLFALLNETLIVKLFDYLVVFSIALYKKTKELILKIITSLKEKKAMKLESKKMEEAENENL